MTSDGKEKKRKRERSGKIASMLGSAARATAGAVVNALYPEDITCNVCLEDLTGETRYRLCAKCLEEMPYVGDRICLSCGMPMDDEADYCLRCQNNERSFKLNRSPFEYDGHAKEMIYGLKFNGRKYLAFTLGAFMADTFLSRKMDAEIAVFVPMTRAEEKKRGFNQSELLAQEVAERLNLPLLPALIKKKSTSEQKALTARERAQNLEGAFECVYSQVKGRKVLLIDDIFTTGATSNECAKTLLKAGAKEVCVLTAAVTKQKMSFEQDN